MTRLALAVVVASTMAVPAAAQGTVNLGSNLGRTPDINHSCGPPCTVAPTTLSAQAALPGGLVSPVNGTVINWRIRVGTATTQIAFRVVKRFADGFATGAGTSAAVTPPVNTTSTFPTQLPIAIGETFGINLGTPAGSFEVGGTGSTDDLWLPVLVDGGPPVDTFLNSPPNPYELAVNAEIEPTSTFTILKAKPKKGGKVQITANLPNPGTLAAGDKSAKLVAAAAGKKVKYLKSKSAQAASPGQVVLVVKPTKAAKAALAPSGRLKAKLKLVFTPTGGTASTQVRKVKLKA